MTAHPTYLVAMNYAVYQNLLVRLKVKCPLLYVLPIG